MSAIESDFALRAAQVSDAAALAKVHVKAWQETYRGQIADDILDSPDFEERRALRWVQTLNGGKSDVVVAELPDGSLIGFASAGPSRDTDLERARELYSLYLLRDLHGTGAGQALFDAVMPVQQAFLWVAAINPRAQAFYRRNGFEPDGTIKYDGIDEIRMVRVETTAVDG